MIRSLITALAALFITALPALSNPWLDASAPSDDIVLAFADIDIAPIEAPHFAAPKVGLEMGQKIPSAHIRPKPRPEGLYETHLLTRLPNSLAGASDFMCLAVAIYHEAGGETRKGQAAVASVILQRAAVPGRWGDTVCDVVVPVQFSFLRRDLSFAPITDYKVWFRALDVATEAVVNGPNPRLKGADHYHATRVNPSWSRHMPVVTRIGAHIFYADPRSARVSG